MDSWKSSIQSDIEFDATLTPLVEYPKADKVPDRILNIAIKTTSRRRTRLFRTSTQKRTFRRRVDDENAYLEALAF